MKDNLFQMLLSLFEKSVAQLKDKNDETPPGNEAEKSGSDLQQNVVCIKYANDSSTRIFTQDERIKLTKASYQFLMRIQLWGILDAYCFELILNQLQNSDSRIVTLQETKWTIRNALADNLNLEQLAFLDLVLYQKEDHSTLH